MRRHRHDTGMTSARHRHDTGRTPAGHRQDTEHNTGSPFVSYFQTKSYNATPIPSEKGIENEEAAKNSLTLRKFLLLTACWLFALDQY